MRFENIVSEVQLWSKSIWLLIDLACTPFLVITTEKIVKLLVGKQENTHLGTKFESRPQSTRKHQANKNINESNTI